MSGGLAPSKSTVYVANVPFSLTNNDLHTLFEKYGRVIKVTVMKNKETRQSKGVAFVLFLDRDSAHRCVRALNNTQLFGRTLKCSIAKDNGRTTEFIRRKDYKDKSRCYECGEFGHLSYNCTQNMLGNREPPKKKEKKNKRKFEDTDEYEEEEQEQTEEDEDEESLSAAIRHQQLKMEEENYRLQVATGNYNLPTTSVHGTVKKRFKKDTYFSDEEEVDED
ncbi:zinc finger CCHC-type and RNA-binding motif-containing protein 1-like [Tachypleus tridentatus]|uniref:zinc finger CCHC-type and RNA-binding motif-containing protein 1-like n=1 Tax=Tachypleus tridentatus TaxID=6853 RepID=UPI003FD1CD90